MAESSRFWTTSGTGDGPAGGYTAAQFYDFVRKMLIGDQHASEGVLKGESNELAVTGAASPLAVNTGSAIVYGFFYENTASVNLTVTTPVVGTTGGHVILRVNWAAQTVRLVAVRNTDGVAAIPSLTQTAGTTWEIRLATFTITTGGVITLTDARTYCHFSTEIIAAMIQDSTITPAKLANRSRTFLVQPFRKTNIVGDQALFAGVIQADAVATTAYGWFKVPDDFSSGMSVAAILIHETTGSKNAYVIMNVYYGAVAEAWDTHQHSGSYAAIAITHKLHNSICSTNLTNVAVGDIVHIEFDRDASNALDTVNGVTYLVGFLVTYTADS